MRIGSGGSQDINQLQSDAAQFRNVDFVVNNEGAFFGVLSLPALAANNGHLQLFNPVASGVVVMIDNITVMSITAGIISTGVFNTELTGDVSAWVNKKVGGAAGAAHLRSQQNAGQLASQEYWGIVAANTSFSLALTAPIMLAAGQGYCVVGTNLNSFVACTFEGREV